MPQLMDQFYWAHRVMAHGIGVRVSRFGSNPQPLAHALELCTQDRRLANRAQQAAQKVQLDGAQRAVTLLEELAS
jgi:UDP:flavonoid glycosyltransferase YjiC (YdhE family)